jgi:hypothetical protein
MDKVQKYNSFNRDNDVDEMIMMNKEFSIEHVEL